MARFGKATLQEVATYGRHAHGKTRGTSITPLYSEIVFASEKDPDLYLALSACEMLRVGRVREVNFARQWLKKFITGKDLTEFAIRELRIVVRRIDDLISGKYAEIRIS